MVEVSQRIRFLKNLKFQKHTKINKTCRSKMEKVLRQLLLGMLTEKRLCCIKQIMKFRCLYVCKFINMIKHKLRVGKSKKCIKIPLPTRNWKSIGTLFLPPAFDYEKFLFSFFCSLARHKQTTH